jgi:hypothetical protein
VADLVLVRRMRRSYYTVTLALFVCGAAVAAPLPPRGAHVLRGPYAFDQRGKRLPEYYDLDGRRVHTVEQLRSAVSQLPPSSLVYFDGTCTSSQYIELGPRPYISFSAFRHFCQSHRVRFDWYIGR